MYLIVTPKSLKTDDNPSNIQYNISQTKILNTLIDSLDTGFISGRFDLDEVSDRKGSHPVVLSADIEDIVSLGSKLNPFVDKLDLADTNTL